MADTPQIPTELPLAPNGEVKAYDRLGNKVTVPKERVGELYAMGGRVARKQEVAEHTAQENYDKQSTAMKVATVASMVGPVAYPLHAYLRGQGAQLPPEMEAYTQGVSEGFTGGLASVGMKEAARVAGGDQAARAYADAAKNATEAHGGYQTAGMLAGFAGSIVAGGPKSGLGKAANVLPGTAISAVGGLAEQGAARALAPVASRGVLGRALATGGEFAARGAAEGALYAGAHQVSEDMLGDREVAADKVFAAMGMGALYGGAGGAVLGAGGSLAASGARATLGAGRSALGRALATKAAEAGAAAEKAAADAQAGAKAIMEAGGAKEVDALRGALGNLKPQEAVKTLAFDALGTTKVVARKINQTVEGGTKAVGDYVARRILKFADHEASLVGSAMKGRSDDLLPLIQADGAKLGSEIGDIVKANPVRVAEGDLMAAASRIEKEMLADPTRIQGAQAFSAQVKQTFDAFRNGGKLVDGSMDLSEMYYQRAAMEKVAHEMKRGNSAAGDAMKSWLREVDSHLVDKIDDAAKAMGDTGARDKLLGLKREYQLSKAAEKAATDGVNRLEGNNIFGIREGIGAAVGFATGAGPIGAAATALGGKLLRERGAAAAAYAINRMSEMGAIQRLVQQTERAMDAAAKGVLAAPAKTAGPAVEIPRARAQQALARVAAIQADPAGYADRVAKSTESMQNVAPNVAAGITQRAVSAAAFLASKVPQVDRDPLDPHPMPKLNKQQEAELARYDYYVEQPMRFFEEASRGKLTYEGAEVAKALMPHAFSELQQRTLAGLADLMTRGQKPPVMQRRKLGLILDVPVTPDQRPEHMQLLQANVLPLTQPNGPTAPKRPLQTKTQPSTLDRLEGR